MLLGRIISVYEPSHRPPRPRHFRPCCDQWFPVCARSHTANNHDTDSLSGFDTMLSVLQSILTSAINELTHRIDVCSQKGMLYAPTSRSKDADGCVAGGGGATMCANDLKFYAPGNANADGNGCVDAMVVNKPKTATANTSADAGSGQNIWSAWFNTSSLTTSNAQNVVVVISVCQGFTFGEKTSWCGRPMTRARTA
jgi:hypothetical protein